LQDFTTWRSAFICDPWAEIACPAPLFPFEWRRQMTEWQARLRVLDKGITVLPKNMADDAMLQPEGLLARERDSALDIYIWADHVGIELTTRLATTASAGVRHEAREVIEEGRATGAVRPIGSAPNALHGELLVPEYLSDRRLHQRCVRYAFPFANTVLS